MAHKDEIQHQIMKKVNPAFIALSETRLTAEIEDSEVNVPGYSIIRCDAENRNTGGVVLYIRDDVKYEIVLLKKLESNCWCAAIEVKEKLYRGIIMVIYHSPSASHGDFVRFLEDIIEELIIRGECMVIGDFNIDIMLDSFYTRKLQTTMLSLSMKQYVNKPTRITKDSKTIIDLIFANDKIEVQVMHEPKITDHAWLKVELNANKFDNKYRELSVRNYREFNIDEFIKLVENKLEKNQDMNISVRAKKFVDSIVNALDAIAPRKNFRIPRIWEGKKWFSDEIREAAAKRDEAYRKALYADTEQNWLQFKIERNTVVKLIKTKKKEYYENMIDLNKENPTSMWKTLKEIIRGEPEEHQSGFRKQYSCETAIQTVIDEWKLIVSEAKMVGVIFMDLKRAFETIDRKRLLEKLYQYGIRGMVIEWLRSYLKDRIQQVQFNNKWSKLMTTEYGVLQGSDFSGEIDVNTENYILKTELADVQKQLKNMERQLAAAVAANKSLQLLQQQSSNSAPIQLQQQQQQSLISVPQANVLQMAPSQPISTQSQSDVLRNKIQCTEYS
ncbi:uncharacterized protein [Polyergus mexicanus]|uniref:uncharacterized protein n=1 Tax=Polyergus mexicanus TaxID=615972 RepID=UPI0038B49899